MHNEYNHILVLFAMHVAAQTWPHVQVLVAGAIPACEQRAVTAILRVMGLGDERHFVNYQRVLHRAAWSTLALSRTSLTFCQ